MYAFQTDSKPPYTLEPGSKKHVCPACEKKRFVRYIHTETREYLSPDCGYCDRRESCGYHLPPREYFANGGKRPEAAGISKPEKPAPPICYTLPDRYMKQTLGRYDQNLFVRFLSGLPGWDQDRAARAARRYLIGTGRKGGVNGWPIFWQIDEAQHVRSGKLIKYDPATGKRIKEGYAYDWIHAKLPADKLPDKFELVQCFFGLHLITPADPRPVAIVESEKTAIIASEYLPAFIWIASGSMNGLQPHKFKPLQGRRVVLYPDCGKAYQEWAAQAEALPIRATVSDLLERAEADPGSDLADYLIRFRIGDFKNPDKKSCQNHVDNVENGSPSKEKFFFTSDQKPPGPATEAKPGRDYPADWDQVKLPERDSAEYAEMIRAEDQAADELPARSLADLKRIDPLVSTIDEIFDLYELA